MYYLTTGIKLYKKFNMLKYFKKFNNKLYVEITSSKKERSDMILEPLQVMIRLALLAHCPIGTKVSVSDNILQLQPPTYLQGVLRWYKE